MEEEPTCGRGLAQTSAVPAGLAAVAAGLAQNLEVHTRALDSAMPLRRRNRGCTSESRTACAAPPQI